MPFKQSHWIGGIDWCLNLKTAERSGLKARYKKNQKVTCRVNRKDKHKVNVLCDGHLVGFVYYPASKKILEAWESGEKIYAVFTSIEYRGLLAANAQITVSTYRRPGTRGSVEPGSSRRPPDRIYTPIQSPPTPSAPHPIMGQVFKRQLNKEQEAAKWKECSGIYCIWHKNHRTYIGQSKKIGWRWLTHLSDLSGGTHHNRALQEDWAQFGHASFRFDVIEFVDAAELEAVEATYIEAYLTYEYGYNATRGPCVPKDPKSTAPQAPKAAHAVTPTPKSTAPQATKAAHAVTPTPKSTASLAPKAAHAVTPTPKSTASLAPKPAHALTPTPKSTASLAPKAAHAVTPTPKTAASLAPEPADAVTPTPKSAIVPTFTSDKTSSLVFVVAFLLALVGGLVFYLNTFVLMAVDEGVRIVVDNPSIPGTASTPIEIDTERPPVDIAIENSNVAIVEGPEPEVIGRPEELGVDTVPAVMDRAFPQGSDEGVDLQPAEMMPMSPIPLVSFTEKSLVPPTSESILLDPGALHFDQLRAAIEGKSMGRVLFVSNKLPGERFEFLQTLFRRYQQLEVVIGDIAKTDNVATGELSVKMFNLHSDGSYYSAGEWNGVTLRVNQVNGNWSKIQW